MKKSTFLIFCGLFLTFIGCSEKYDELDEGLYAEFITNKGTFVAELFYEATPITIASFVSLAEGTSEMVDEEYKGKKFYNGLIFHRVIEDFMIQGGDPTGTGTGGPGYMFPNEIVDTLQHDSAGILSMANSGPNTNGSQFFITLKETPWLDGVHTVFGRVVENQAVVDSIGTVETGPGDKPLKDVVIQEVNIIRKGSEAKNFKAAEVLKTELQKLEEEKQEQERIAAERMAAKVSEFEEWKLEAEELPSGLKIYFNEKSDGETPELGDTVDVYYQGYLANGELFDTNIEELAKEAGVFNQRRKDQGGYAPLAMEYSPNAPTIPGFKEGVQQMSVGDKATLFIPAHLGYGAQGYMPVIPPNTDLVFQVELVGIQE